MKQLILSILMVATLSGCMNREAEKSADLSKESLADLPHFTECAESFEVLELLEGLPRSATLSKSSKGEFMERAVVKLDRHSFYEEPLETPANDEAILRSLLSDTALYKPHSGMERCGGFHPDFGVKLLSKSEVAYVYICFGCDEIKAYRGKKALHADLSRDYSERLKELLIPYSHR
ncbi:MAG: hypothetical protein ACSHYA_19370 [Opitutaceae bacterium]